MPEPEVEYAVRLEDGRVWPRRTREGAEVSIRSITSRGGPAVLLSRTVVRSEWTEVGAAGDAITELASWVEQALRTVPVRLGPNALAILSEGGTVPLSGGEYSAMALAVAMMLAGEEL